MSHLERRSWIPECCTQVVEEFRNSFSDEDADYPAQGYQDNGVEDIGDPTSFFAR